MHNTFAKQEGTKDQILRVIIYPIIRDHLKNAK